jgi:hypothetical protein
MHLLIDWTSLKPESLFGGQVLERAPAALSLIYLLGMFVLLGLLISTFLRQVKHPYRFEAGIPSEIRRRLSLTLTNRGLHIWHAVFVILAAATFGFHVYWALVAEDTNEDFQSLAYKDLRQRRTTALTLRGWILDRSGELSKALAYYRVGNKGLLTRTYALDSELSHLFGSELGSPGLERTLFQRKSDPMPESWQALTKIRRYGEDSADVRLTIDRDLQEFVARQLKGKKGSIVVIHPQTGDVLAIYSSPSYSLLEIDSLGRWIELEGNQRDKPLLNRAMREYYVPGSTFKLFTMIAAFRAGKQNDRFTSLPGGYVPFRGSRSITDANRGCEPPYGCTSLDLAQAFEASSNQYFSQMAVALGRDRLKETAKLFGIAAYDTPAETGNMNLISDFWSATDDRVRKGLAVEQSAIVTGKGISAYDLALQGMGQGYAGQMTPFQMALITAAAGNLEGRLMKPRIEFDAKVEPFSQVLSAKQAADIRSIMARVTEGAGGTATSAFAAVRSAGIRTGGKTGTAEKLARAFDLRTGKPLTERKTRRNADGELEEYDAPMMYERTDSWYISIAPLEHPTLAIAVVVEGGGFGGRVAAPIAADIVLKARSLGLLGDRYPAARSAERRGRR